MPKESMDVFQLVNQEEVGQTLILPFSSWLGCSSYYLDGLLAIYWCRHVQKNDVIPGIALERCIHNNIMHNEKY